MLGHDLRSPLSAIVMTAKCLAQLHAGQQVSEAAEILIRSGESMQMLLDDLTDFNRTNLGLGLKIVPSEIDLAKTAQNELEQFRAAYPDRRIEFAPSGDTHRRWDAVRVQQLLRNLVSNAIRHGSPDTPVLVALRGEQPEVRLEVTNSGRIEPSEIRQIFDPLRRGTSEGASHEATEGLGLGLFIVREIAKAHGGEVEAHCEGDQTTFAVRLPRPKGTSVA